MARARLQGDAVEQLVELAERWRAARREAETARQELAAACRAANEAGVSAYSLQRACGVGEVTMRRWVRQ